MSLFAVH